LAGEIKLHRKLVGVVALALLLAIGGIVFALYKFGGQDKPTTPPAPFQAMKMTKLTSNGKATQAVISPDGKQVVYVIDDGGRRSLWLRQVATATDVQLIAPEDIQYWSLTISRDGNFLYYVFGGTTINNRVLYQMPLFGGSPRKVVEDLGSPIGFSPDGKQIAFVRSGQGESSLMLANADGTEERKIAIRQGPNRFGNFFFGGVAWSPDGKKIASIARGNDSAGRFQNVVEVTIEGGTERLLTSQRWFRIQRLAWLSDGSGLLISAAEKASDFHAQQIWYLPYPSGEARKITNDLNNYGSIRLNADSSILVTIQEDKAANIWVAPNGDASRATQLSSVSSKLDGFDGVTWTPDSKIVYHSMAGGKEGIWIMEADGKNRRQLTTGETVDFNPSVSADGRYVVFTSERTGAPGIWRMDIDGGNPKQLVSNGSNWTATAAEWVVYGLENSLWKVPIDGGEPVQIGGENMVRCAVSPDGKLVACSLENPGSPAKLAVISIEGGAPVKVFDAQIALPARIRWMPDGRVLTYVSSRDGAVDIWSQPIDGGEPKKLTDFKANRIFSFDWSRDNKLVISHGTSTSDVVLIRNAK
jgi:Tol biopolymer transport system component